MNTAINEVLLGSISGDENDHIVEVVVVEDGSKNRYEIRLLSFGEGIGWYVQKTLPLDSNQARALGRVLSRTDNDLQRKLIKQDELPASRKVVSLPL
ncbi:MAG TPA: hypothetical protein VNN20_14145 [Thermodesulfobacteriota bacterium]|nr:hypothetical protein [Thermodesulfobacteriota bacterium]